MDYFSLLAHSIVVLATSAAVCACVLLHYESLSLLSRWLVRLHRHHRRRVLFGIFGVLITHVAEIWIFGIGFDLLSLSPAFGTILGVGPGLLDRVYVSAMTFTTVGAGSIHIEGPLRLLEGTEALCGLVLITWSASFTYIEMERFWRGK